MTHRARVVDFALQRSNDAVPIVSIPEDDVEFVLCARRQCTPVIAEITARPVGHAIAFEPGQYMLVQDATCSVPVRSYSVANAPRDDGTLTFLVTAVAGGATSTLLAETADVGTPLLVSGPYGSFVRDRAHDGPTLYLSGGSGLAPARSLIEARAHGGELDDPATGHTLVFSGRTAADLIDEADFRSLADARAGFEFVRTLTRVPEGAAQPPLGRVPDILPGIVNHLSAHAVYIAGAPGFVASCTKSARALGAHSARIHTEEFYAEPAPWPAGSATVGDDETEGS